MKIANKLTSFFVLGLSISNAQAVETNSAKAIAEASFDWGSFTISTSAAPGSSEPAPTIQWQYQDAYATSNSQKDKAVGWNTSLEIAENGISSWSKITPAAVHSYAIDTNVSPESKSWSSSYRVGGFTVTGNGTVTFSANYSLTSTLSPGSILPSYADAAALLSVRNIDNVLVVSQKDAVDLNNSNANANNNAVTKANKLVLNLPVQDGQQFKFSADIHAKAGLSNTSSVHSTEAMVLGNWCADVNQSCDAAFRVDLTTGKRTLISAYTKTDENKLFDDPSAPATVNRGGKWWEKVAIGATGDIFIYADNRYDIKADSSNKSIYRISPTDGSRQLISDLSDAKSGVALNTVPDNMVISATNQILLGAAGKVISFDPGTSQLMVLTDSSVSSQGPAFTALLGTDPYGELFGLDVSGLIKIDSNTGLRSSFANYGIVPSNSISLIHSSGNLIAAENGLLNKHNNFGSTSLISDLHNQAQGPVVSNVKALNEAGDGRLVLLDSGSNGALVTVDAKTGVRTLVSDFQDQSKGPVIYDARAIAVGGMPVFTAPAVTDNDITGGASGNQPILSQAEQLDPALTGQPLSYVVTFSNYAAEFATNTRLFDRLPKKAKLVSVVPSQGTCKGKATVVCNVGPVAPGARVTARITVTHAKPAQVQNTAIVTYKMKKLGAKKKKNFRLVSREATAVN
ncbi:MAG: hypothetical protein ABL925_14890 [Methylococcales bacterium]